MTVSGLTMTSAVRHPVQMRDSQTQSQRSAFASRTRRGRVRCSTYFQFGGSDFVMVFERTSNVQLIAQPTIHYNQGSWIGNAYPYATK